MPRPKGLAKTGGRKRGVTNKRTQATAKKAAAKGLSPVEYMLDILRDEGATAEDRKWAAEKAAPYVHPRLAAVEQRERTDDESHEDWLERVAKKAGL